jgi:hypothetical protein
MEAPTGDPSTAWFRLRYPDRDALLQTQDGGVTTTQRLEVLGGFTDVAVEPDGTLWLATVDGGFVYAYPGEGAQGADVPPGRGVGARDGLIWLTSSQGAVALEASGASTDDVVSSVVVYDLEGPRACPEESDAGLTCPDAWDALQESLDAVRDTGSPAGDTDLSDPPEPVDPEEPADPAPNDELQAEDPAASCGCSTGAPLGHGLLVWLAVWWGRRRRAGGPTPS